MRSFGYALHGWKLLFLHEHNARIHLGVGILAILLGIYLGLSSLEWVALGLTIGLVLFAEAINSAVEYLADAITLEHRLEIQYAKDLAAGAVLFTAFCSLVVGSILFIPKIWKILR